MMIAVKMQLVGCLFKMFEARFFSIFLPFSSIPFRYNVMHVLVWRAYFPFECMKQEKVKLLRKKSLGCRRCHLKHRYTNIYFKIWIIPIIIMANVNKNLFHFVWVSVCVYVWILFLATHKRNRKINANGKRHRNRQSERLFIRRKQKKVMRKKFYW